MNKAIIVSLCVIPAAAGVVVATNPSSTAAPHTTILESVEALRDNDLSRLLSIVATEEELASFEADWNEKRSIEVEPSDEFGFKFAMGMVTEDGAEAMLMSQLEPKLIEMREQSAFFAQMVSGMAQAQIDGQAGLTAEQRDESAAVVAALEQLLVNNDFTDPKRAREAIDILCRTARSLEVDSLQTLNALEFDELVAKGDVALAGVKEILALYGLEIDAWLDSVEAETIEEKDGHARVRVSYEVLGMQQDTELELDFVDGRWISKQAAALR